MKTAKTVIFTLLILTAIFSFTACSSKDDTSDTTFPGIDNADIPDILETTVGTLGNIYFSSGITDNPNYTSILRVTFEDITEADYTALIEHYQSASTGMAENGTMLFDWGQLQVTSDKTSVTINAYIK